MPAGEPASPWPTFGNVGCLIHAVNKDHWTRVACTRFRMVAMAGLALSAAFAAAPATVGQDSPRQAASPAPVQPASRPARHARPRLDTSGRQRQGVASVYAKKFDGRKMADGTPMSVQGDNAASKTLPLGTTAKVTNVETGESAVVTIRDRGPHVKGRIIDLSPQTASEVGIDRRQGVSKVEVTPLALPPRDGASDSRDAPPEANAARAAPRSATPSGGNVSR